MNATPRHARVCASLLRAHVDGARGVALPNTGGVVDLVEGRIDQAPREILYLEVPVGFVMQLRVVVRSASVTFDDGTVVELTVPSGATSGLKIGPEDGEPPFEVVDNERSAVAVRLNLFEQLIRNQGREFLMKPTLEARPVPVSYASPLFFDRIVVRYYDPTPDGPSARCPLDAVRDHASVIGASVLDYDPTTNYFVMGLPASITPQDAGEYFYTKLVEFEDSVLGIPVGTRYCVPHLVMPDHFVDANQAVVPLPCDGAFMGSFAVGAINLGEAWQVARGDRSVVVAIPDDGFDLDHPDLRRNWYLNPRELPARLIDASGQPVAGTGFAHHAGDPQLIEQDDLDALDAMTPSPDGVFDFVDLNVAAVSDAVCGNLSWPCPGGGSRTLDCDLDCDGDVTPLDVVSGAATHTPFTPCTTANQALQLCTTRDGCARGTSPFEDGDDTDRNGLCDDLVGWDFGDKDNLVHDERPEAHGTRTAGVIGGSGSFFGPGGTCDGELSAGVMLAGVRMLPIKGGVDAGALTRTWYLPRSEAYLASRYAYLNPDVHIVHIAFSKYLTRFDSPLQCSSDVDVIENVNGLTPEGVDKWDKVNEFFREEGQCMVADVLNTNCFGPGAGIGEKVAVIAASNCGIDLDATGPERDDLFVWPHDLDVPGSVIVGGVSARAIIVDNEFLRWQTGELEASAWGATRVQLSAPADSYQAAAGDDTVQEFGGTSLSAAMVTGITGLVVGHHQLQAQPLDAIEILLRTAQRVPELVADFEQGRIVAPTNAVMCNLGGGACSDERDCCSRICSAGVCGEL